MSHTLTKEESTVAQAQAQPIFKGWLTQLLHEAFYMEENPDAQLMKDPTPDEKSYEEEEEVERFEFLKQFLSGRSIHLN